MHKHRCTYGKRIHREPNTSEPKARAPWKTKDIPPVGMFKRWRKLANYHVRGSRRKYVWERPWMTQG